MPAHPVTSVFRRPCAALLVAALGLSAVLAAAPAHAGDPVVGKAKAMMCNVCHGPLGIATAPETPNLAGQPANYIVQQLRHFKEGLRRHEVMSVMARTLTDADMDHLGAWFSSIQIEAKAP
jgi:cytochrome c553